VAEAAGQLAGRVDWETVAVDGTAITRWAGRTSLSGPRGNASVAADPATLPQSVQTARELAALLELDVTGMDIMVVSDPAEISALDARGLHSNTPAAAHGAQIRLGPAAFASWDTLAKNLAYQAHIAARLRAGQPPTIAPHDHLEADAIALLVDQTLSRLAGNDEALAALAARYGGVTTTGQIIDFHENGAWPSGLALSARAERLRDWPPAPSSFRPTRDELQHITPGQLPRLSVSQQREARNHLLDQTTATSRTPPADAGLRHVFDHLAQLERDISTVAGLRPVGRGWYQATTADGRRLLIGIQRGTPADGSAAATTRWGADDPPT
jgi:hypothetical protein